MTNNHEAAARIDRRDPAAVVVLMDAWLDDNPTSAKSGVSATARFLMFGTVLEWREQLAFAIGAPPRVLVPER